MRYSITIDPQGGGDKSIAGSLPSRYTAANGLVDKTLLLDIALGIEKDLEDRGIRVAMTRKSDRNLSKAKRAQVARDTASDVFVSLCFSGSADSTRQGVSAIVYPDATDESVQLAELLQQAVADALDHPVLGVNKRPRAGLRRDRLPVNTAACELAICFLSDPDEAELLINLNYQQRISKAIADALWQHATTGSPPAPVSATSSLQAAPEPSLEKMSIPGAPDAALYLERHFDMATIIIDPGHGGSSNLPCSSWNNARGPEFGTLEKDLTLDVALRLKRAFERRGHTQVVMTRSTDVNVGGRERAQFAQQHDAEVLVSIHFNASNGHNAQGTETFIHRNNSLTGASAQLCRSVQAAVLRATGLRDRNALHPPHFVKTAGWCVINPRDHAPRTAAVLTEISFLDRVHEEHRLQRDSYREEIAHALADGIEDYLSPSVDNTAYRDDNDLEDAVSEAAARAGKTVAEMLADVAAPEPAGTGSTPIRRERGGHEIANALSDSAIRAGSSVQDIARLLSTPVLEQAEDSDERSEGAGQNGADAPNFAGFGQDPDADAATLQNLFGGSMAALTSFDHPAFADFVRGLNLRYFQPIELLWLGSQHNRPGHDCAGLNALPPRSLWSRIAPTIRMLDEIRARHGAPIRILSAYRNDAYNACVGGKASSLHKEFNAIDWTSTAGTVAQWHQLARQVRASDASFAGGIGDYPNSNFVHIDTRGYNADF